MTSFLQNLFAFSLYELFSVTFQNYFLVSNFKLWQSLYFCLKTIIKKYIKQQKNKSEIEYLGEYIYISTFEKRESFEPI